MSTTTARLMVASPRGTLTHLSRHGELTLCGRIVPAAWSAEPVLEGRTPSCASCRAAGEIDAMRDRNRAVEPVQLEEETPAPQLPATSDARTLLVVPCSGAKLTEPAPAAELYRGTLTTMGLAACSVVAQSHVGTRTMILSALHGLVDTDRVLAPYDLQMGQPGSITTEQLADQLRATGATRVVSFAPTGYTAALREACALAGLELLWALEGCRGIGEQRGVLARYRRSGGITSPYTNLPDLRLETRVLAKDHALALELYAAAQAAPVRRGSSPVRAAVARVLTEDLPTLAETQLDRGRRAVRRLEDRRRHGSLQVPPAGKPALC